MTAQVLRYLSSQSFKFILCMARKLKQLTCGCRVRSWHLWKQLYRERSTSWTQPRRLRGDPPLAGALLCPRLLQHRPPLKMKFIYTLVQARRILTTFHFIRNVYVVYSSKVLQIGQSSYYDICFSVDQEVFTIGQISPDLHYSTVTIATCSTAPCFKL